MAASQAKCSRAVILTGVIGSHLFQQVDELISGQPLQQGEVGRLRGISPGTVSHTGPRLTQDRRHSSTVRGIKLSPNVTAPDYVLM